jgi:hypothetical protein
MVVIDSVADVPPLEVGAVETAAVVGCAAPLSFPLAPVDPGAACPARAWVSAPASSD